MFSKLSRNFPCKPQDGKLLNVDWKDLSTDQAKNMFSATNGELTKKIHSREKSNPNSKSIDVNREQTQRSKSNCTILNPIDNINFSDITKSKAQQKFMFE